MADTSSKRGLFKLVAAVGAIVLIAGIVMFLLATRHVNLTAYDAPQSAVSADGTTISGTSDPKAYVNASASFACDATADANGAWSCKISAPMVGADAAAKAGDTDLDGATLSADGLTLSGTGAAAGASVSATATSTCDATADAKGTWACALSVTSVGADAYGYVTNPVTSTGLGVAAIIVMCLGAVLAIGGGVGLIFAGGRPIGLLSLLLIPVGVALDFALAALNTVLKLPLFLDSVGHILAGLLGGPVIGGVTGFLGVLTNASFQPAAVVWCFQGATVGVVVGLLSQAGMFKGIRRIVVSTLIVIATSATLSSVISLVVYGGIDGYTISFLRAALTNLGWSMSSAVVVTSVVIELIDKTISVGLPLLVIAGMSNRLLNQFVTGPKLRDLKVESVATAAADVSPTDVDGGYGSYDDESGNTAPAK